MGQKNSQTNKFELKNFKEVYDYCYVNGIMDINNFIEKCFKKGFDIEKYGLLGDNNEVVEKEVIVEKIVEKVIEVPVEKIVEVVKEVNVGNEKMKMLQETLLNQKKELNLKNEKIKELEQRMSQLESIKINQGAVFLKGSNLNNKL